MRGDNGAPVENATIEVVGSPGSTPQPNILTDSAGSSAINDLSEGKWVLSAMSSGKHCQATAPVFSNGTSYVTIEIGGLPYVRWSEVYSTNKREKGMSGSVRGRVVRANNGMPLRDVTIIVVRSAGPAPDIAPLTDGAGRFALEGLREGEWLLRALGPGGETGEATVQMSAGSVTDTIIKVAPTQV